jgi:hypothetical protein
MHYFYTYGILSYKDYWIYVENMSCKGHWIHKVY